MVEMNAEAMRNAVIKFLVRDLKIKAYVDANAYSVLRLVEASSVWATPECSSKQTTRRPLSSCFTCC